MLERLAEGNGEKVRIIKVDANKNRAWAAKEQIRGVPAFQFYRGGTKVHEFVGAPSEVVMQRKIDHYSASVAGQQNAEGKPAPEPSIRPMPKDWLPSGVTRE